MATNAKTQTAQTPAAQAPAQAGAGATPPPALPTPTAAQLAGLPPGWATALAAGNVPLGNAGNLLAGHPATAALCLAWVANGGSLRATKVATCLVGPGGALCATVAAHHVCATSQGSAMRVWLNGTNLPVGTAQYQGLACYTWAKGGAGVACLLLGAQASAAGVAAVLAVCQGNGAGRRGRASAVLQTTPVL